MDLLTVAEADTSELDEINEFMKLTPQLVAPSVDKQLEAIAGGLYFTVRDADRRLLGVTSTISTDMPDYQEMANSSVAPAWQGGFGFQHLFYQLRAAAVATLYDMPPRQLTAIHPNNPDPRSLKNTLRVGFIPSTTSWGCGDCIELAGNLQRGRKCCHDIFELPISRHRALCTEFLELTKNGAPFLRVGKVKSVRIMVDCFVALGQRQRQMVHDFARG